MSKTELMVAAFEGRENDVRELLHLYAGMADSNGQTAMMFAASAGHAGCVQLLMGKEQRMQVKTGETALMFAAYNNQAHIVSILLPYEQRMQDAGGQTALMSSVYKQSTMCFQLLLEAEAGIQGKDGATAMMIASRLGWVEIVSIAVPYEARLTDINGMTALMFAAQTGKVQCGHVLLAKEGSMQSIAGRSALMIAAAAGHSDMVKLLISAEAGLKDAQGHTALMYAAHSGRTHIVELLLPYESGQYNNDHNTALILAIQNYHIGAAILLLSTEEQLTNRQGQSSLEIARSLGLTQIIAVSEARYRQQLKLSKSFEFTNEDIAQNISKDVTFNQKQPASPKVLTKENRATYNAIDDDRMSIRELERTTIKDSGLRELFDFYERDVSILPQSKPSSDTHENWISGTAENQLKADKFNRSTSPRTSILQDRDPTPERSSGFKPSDKQKLHKLISKLSQQIHILSQSLCKQEERVNELTDKIEKAFESPAENKRKDNNDKIWKATRQIIEQNESQVIALGYNLHSVQKSIKGIASDFAKFKESSRACIKELEQQCDIVSSKLDEESLTNKRNISNLQIEIAELRSQTSGRTSKNFSAIGADNSDDEAIAISPRMIESAYSHRRRGGTPRSKSAFTWRTNSISCHQPEQENLHIPKSGFIKRLKTAVKYLFTGH